MTTTVRRRQQRTRGYAAWLGAVLAFGAAWAVVVLVPYYVNGLHHLTLTEVASGAHDPKDLWPLASGPSVFGVLTRLLGLFLVVPLVSMVGIVSSAVGILVLARRWRSLTTVARSLGVMAVLASLVIAAVTLSPWGRALQTWWLD